MLWNLNLDLGHALQKDSDDSSFSSQSLNNQKDWQGASPANSDSRLFKRAVWSSEGRNLVSGFHFPIFQATRML